MAQDEPPPRADEGQGARDDGGKRSEPPKRRGPLQNPLVLLGIGAVVLVVVIGVVIWWLEARRWQATDDAYVDGHIVHLAPQVAGVVVKIYVTDNAEVRVGQPIVDIDPSTFSAQYQQANAQAAQTEAQVGQQRAQVVAARASFEQANADAAAAAAQAQEAADDLARYRNLRATAPQAVSAQQFDQALQAARNTAALHLSALKKAQNAAAQIRVAEVQIKAFEAQHAASQAQARQSHITLGYARIAAPIDGHIAHLNIAPGGYVQPGQELMAIVPDNLWVTANYKETQLTLMRVGQRADVKIDACSGSPLRAHVDSIQRGAGQAFALLPPENATGNFVKVVQRVPVKLVFDRLPRDCPIGPGMSVQPRVLVRP
jgi:membrane fusion protein (multidrug efflux system)